MQSRNLARLPQGDAGSELLWPRSFRSSPPIEVTRIEGAGVVRGKGRSLTIPAPLSSGRHASLAGSSVVVRALIRPPDRHPAGMATAEPMPLDLRCTVGPIWRLPA